jgi:hypothetical protein
MTATMAQERTLVVESMRDRIDEITDPQMRRAILRDLGCFERHKDRRRKVPGTTRGAELLAAIDAFDIACLQGSDEEIEVTGVRLIFLWAQRRTDRRGSASDLWPVGWHDRSTCRYCGDPGGLTVIACDTPMHPKCLETFKRDGVGARAPDPFEGRDDDKLRRIQVAFADPSNRRYHQ